MSVTDHGVSVSNQAHQGGLGESRHAHERDVQSLRFGVQCGLVSSIATTDVNQPKAGSAERPQRCPRSLHVRHPTHGHDVRLGRFRCRFESAVLLSTRFGGPRFNVDDVHEVRCFQWTPCVVPDGRFTVFLGRVGFQTVHRFQSTLNPHRVARDRSTGSIEKHVHERTVSATLDGEQQTGQPQRTLWFPVEATMKHVLVQPTGWFEAVVVHRKMSGNQRENLKRASAH